MRQTYPTNLNATRHRILISVSARNEIDAATQGAALNTFKEFYRNTKDRFFGYLLRRTGDYHQAADIMQESFTRYLERYETKEPNTSLLFTIGRNLLVDDARRLRTTIPFDEKIHDRPQGRDPSLIREESQWILQAIAQLEPEEADILALVTGSDFSYKEVAQLTGISEANIKVKIHRSRQKLKKILRDGAV